MFGQIGTSTLFGSTTTTMQSYNPMKDIEVTSPPDDTISSLAFSPGSLAATYLTAGSWDNNVRCWEVQQNGTVIPKAMQTHAGPVLDVSWSDDGSKIFTGSADKTAKMWDLASNQHIQVAQHDGPVKTVHWVKGTNYSCLMTGSWDKTLRFWDTRQPNPMMTMQLPERVYCADVVYPMAVVGTSNRGIIIYQLENQPTEFKRMESPLKYQHRCVSIFVDRKTATVSPQPIGFALGSIEGGGHTVRVTARIQRTTSRSNVIGQTGRVPPAPTGHLSRELHRIPSGSRHSVDRRVGRTVQLFGIKTRAKLKTSEQLDLPITSCGFNAQGNIFAYASGYDWSKGHEAFDPQKMKPHIMLRSCFEELKQSQKKT